jgi:hypothetical protein
MVKPFANAPNASMRPESVLPAVLLSRYLFFLTQRPISRSNTHFVRQRIRGLQSLGPLLDGGQDELLSAGARLLETLGPSNVYEVSERIQQILFPFARAEVPTAYISADAPPPPGFLGACEHILLVLGPAIGIGDEIVTFPLPRWIKRANPGAHLTTLTAYEGLWDGVPGVDRVETYVDHTAIVGAMRGEHDVGDADLVVLVDFENPELHKAVTAEPGIAKYAELSLGARALAAVDNREGWTYHQTLPAGSFRNVYDGFDELARRLGVSPDAADRLDRAAGRSGDGGELRVFVSPFSSKYDPSPRYWSALLATLVPDETARAVRFVLDPGPNRATGSFAAGVARAAAARRPKAGVSFTVAHADRGGTLSLPGVFAELARAELAVCADSFTAHAAPRMACTTIVVASPGLENWRVPSDRSYYFDAETPLADLVAGMRQILELHGVGAAASVKPPVGDPEARLAAADAELGAAVTDDAGFEALCSAYERFSAARAAVLGRVADWPPAAAALAADHGYDIPARDLNGHRATPAGLEPDLRRFVQDHWLSWRNTNLRKYLHRRLGEVRR